MTRKQISLKEGTYKELDQRRSPGQSFDGAVTELLQSQKIEVET